MENSSLCSMNMEFLSDMIMSRLDGSTLAASACACSDLRTAASDQNLWKKLCNSTWPSTKFEDDDQLISSASHFYADAFPLILWEPEGSHHTLKHHQVIINPTVTRASGTDLASLVDIYYKGRCILSKVLGAIPEPEDVSDENKDENEEELRQWLLNCPFSLNLLPSYDDYDTDISSDDGADNHELNHGGDGDLITQLPSLTSSTEGEKIGSDLRENLAEDIRLSWILLNKKSGKAVNLSSWKPLSVQKSWAPEGEYVLHFGSIVPVENKASHKFAECKIVARCQLINNSGWCAKWMEISMRVEDMAGAHLNKAKSLATLSQALYSRRTTKHLEVEKGYAKYKAYKKELKRIKDRHEYLVNKLYTLVGLTMLTTITYGCTLLFHGISK